MDYLSFLLVFFAIMVLFQLGWFSIGFIITRLENNFIRNGLIENPHVFLRLHSSYMIIYNIIYCFLLISLSVLVINKFRIINSSYVFVVFMIVIMIIYFVSLFIVKRKGAEEKYQSGEVLQTIYYIKLRNTLISIEMIFILLFIPLVFFPNVIDNVLTSWVYDGLYYVATIKILGVIIGLCGLLHLIILLGALPKQLE